MTPKEQLKSLLEEVSNIYKTDPIAAVNMLPDVLSTCLELVNQIEDTNEGK